MTQVLVIGLDCAPPALVFDRWKNELPALSRLIDEGLSAPLRSTIPPITVPAWTAMMSGKSPGTLGFYGFRNRGDHSYQGLVYANNTAVKDDRVWDVLGRAGHPCVMVGVPQTYPPRPVNGVQVGCFLTPDIQSEYTYPAAVKQEIASLVGEYILDVKDFRSENKQQTLDQIHTMTERRMTVVKHFLKTKPWDFFMFVEMGTDRIHHGFWKDMDPEHRKHEKGGRYANAIRDYYKKLDAHLAEILSIIPKETHVFVVSDHGAKRMDGGICINEWLQREGYLKLKNPPAKQTPFAKVEVDWANTRAWAEGGYYGRLFLNVEGREPQGTIPKSRYDQVRNEIKSRLEALGDENGRPIGTICHKPEEIYPATNGVAPDLIVYFGDLYWRAVAAVGMGTIHTFENDTGPDDANHAQHGIFIYRAPDRKIGRREKEFSILDVGPTILSLFGQPLPPRCEGRPLEGVVAGRR